MRTKSVLLLFLVVTVIISVAEGGNYWARKGGNRHVVKSNGYRSFRKRLGLSDRVGMDLADYPTLEELLANEMKRALDDGY